MKTKFWLAGKLFIILAILPLIILAQDNEPKIKVETNLVNVNVLITDKDGKSVKGLERDQFEVYDNNIKQKIEHFSAGEAPVSFGIVYDMHPTTSEMNSAVINSLKQFSKGLNKEDDLFVLAFNQYGSQKFDFVPTTEQLETFLQRPEKREPNSLYDAIYETAEKLRGSRNLKRAIIIVSDSADHSSRNSFTKLRQKLKSTDIDVYAIIFDVDKWHYSDLSHIGKTQRKISEASSLERAAISELTMKSGGTTYFSTFNNSLQLYSTYKQIAEEINNHYTIGYYPESFDGKQHNLMIRLRNVKDYKGLALTYKHNYQIPMKTPNP